VNKEKTRILYTFPSTIIYIDVLLDSNIMVMYFVSLYNEACKETVHKELYYIIECTILRIDPLLDDGVIQSAGDYQPLIKLNTNVLSYHINL